MTNFQLPDPDREQNPTYNFNKITTSVVRRSDGWHIIIRKWHDETGAERLEESSMRWATEEAAEATAIKVAETMRERITKSYGAA